VLKKLNNLGISEFSAKQEMLKLSAGDMIFVNDPNVQNPQVISKLKGIASLIVYNGKLSGEHNIHNLSHFETISSEGLRITEYTDFVSVPKEDIDKRLEKKI
jgi:predicted RNase H-like nuclease (RuvC/YqgF family)